KTQQLVVETNDLKKKTRVFHQNMLMILESQLDVMKGGEWDELLKPFSYYITEPNSMVKEILGETLYEEGETTGLRADKFSEEELNDAVVTEDFQDTTTIVFPSDEDPYTTSETEQD